jgi:hypothetical protein
MKLINDFIELNTLREEMNANVSLCPESNINVTESANASSPVSMQKISHDDITKEIAIIWHIDDVQNIRPDLSKQQASDVLIHLKENHDASEDINWDTIETVADILFPSEISDTECEESSL